MRAPAPTRVLDRAARHAGALVQALPFLHDEPLPPSQPPTTRTFVRKLVGAGTLRAGLSIHYEGWLKGLVLVDHYTNVLAGSSAVLADLTQLKDLLRERTAKPMLPLELVLAQLGAWSWSLPAGSFAGGDGRLRFAALDVASEPASPALVRGADPWYLALGAFLADLLGPLARPALERVRSREELRALLFVDAALRVAPCPEAERALVAGDFVGAALAAAEALRSWATPDVLRGQVEAALKRTERPDDPEE